MKRIYKASQTLLPLFLSALLYSCASEESTPALTVSQLEISGLQAAGDETNIPVESSSAWTATSSNAWLEVVPSADGSTLTLKASENLWQDSRSATVTLVNSENMEQEITVKQDAYAFDENHTYKLPVVFHMLYWNKNNSNHYLENGHLQKILDGVNQLYRQCGTDVRFEFVMAEEDNQGKKLEEPGVNRVEWEFTTMDHVAFMASGKAEYKELIWDPTRYINVVLYNFSNAQVMGVSQLPLLPAPYELGGITQVSSTEDLNAIPYPQCVCVNNKYIYDIPEGDEYIMSNVIVTLAHELAHYMGLFHVFNEDNYGNTNVDTDSDYCTDTPPYNKYLYDLKLNSFLAGNKIDTDEEYETWVKRTNSLDGTEFRSTNVMDYAVSDGNKLTAQQAERLHYALHHSCWLPGPKDFSQVQPQSSKAQSTFSAAPRFIE